MAKKTTSSRAGSSRSSKKTAKRSTKKTSKKTPRKSTKKTSKSSSKKTTKKAPSSAKTTTGRAKTSKSASKTRASKTVAKPAKTGKAAATADAKAAAASSAAAEKAPPKLAQPKLVQNSTLRSKRRRVTRPVSNGDSTLAAAAAKLAGSDEIPFLSETALKRAKSDLTRKDINAYRRSLTEKRAQILGDVALLEEHARENTDSGNLSNMPQHMSDVGTDNFEQEFNLDLAESERRLVKEIDEALMRIYNSVYGVCLVTGAPIGKPRLDAKPWAKYTIETVRELERLGKL